MIPKRFPPLSGKRWPDCFAVDSLTKASGLERAPVANLPRRYGVKAGQVAAMVADGERQALGRDGQYHEGEIRWIVRNERVTRLADIVLRRTLLPFENAITADIVTGIAAIAASELGWDEARRAEEVKLTTALLTRHHRVKSLAAAAPLAQTTAWRTTWQPVNKPLINNDNGGARRTSEDH